MTKTPTSWSPNPSANASLRNYDSATDEYNSASQNYDGVVDADMADSEKVPTSWSEA